MTGWPLVYNGVTYTEADFAGNKYAATMPRFFNDVGQHLAQFSQSLSATELTIADSGDITLTVAANKNYAAGQPIRIARTAAPADDWMGGTCLAYDVSTGVMSVRRSSAEGSGTYAAWTVSVDGGAGPIGDEGPIGDTPVTVTTSAAALPVQLGSTGSFACATETDLGLGSPVILVSQADPGVWMHGLVTAKAGVNLTVMVQRIAGSGSPANWYVALSGALGATGGTGATGPAGADGRVPGFDEFALERTSRLAMASAYRL